MFNPSRLTLARKRRGFTGKELAYRAKLTPVHVSRMEQGKAENLEQSTIDSVASALEFPVGFFSGDDLDEVDKDGASFRSLSAMTAKERDSALSAGSIAFLFSDWVADRFNLPAPDLLDLRHEKDPEAAATALRSYWGLGSQPISNVIKLLESKGVRVFSLSESTRNVDAFSCWRNGVPYIFLNTFKTAERSKFDALHELGHLVLHQHGKPQGREAEVEADRFASSFFLPQMDVLGHVPFVTSLSQLVKAKKRWGCSVSALAYRLNKLGKISDWQYRTFCIQMNSLYGRTEPEGITRERSVLWEKVFRELWKDKATKDHVAKELCLPNRELEQLVFSLVDVSDHATNMRKAGPPKLKLA